mgnify:CR=1 FL=1
MSNTLPAHIYSAVIDMLTPSDQVAILLAAGLPAGRAENCARGGPAYFWGALENQLKVKDPAVWHNYPACWALITGAATSPPPPSIAAAANARFETSLVYKHNLHKRLIANELEAVAYWLYRNAPPASRQFLNPDFFRGDPAKVFRVASDLMLSVGLVAQAIDLGAGKKVIAEQLRGDQSAGSQVFADAQPPAAPASPLEVPEFVPTNTLARDFENSAAVATAASFIRDGDNLFLQKICMALNETESYTQLLSLFGIQVSTETSLFLAKLRERWLAGRVSGNRGNPALELLKQLCGSDKFASQPATELAAQLMRVNAAPVQAAVAAWITASADGQKEAAEAAQAAVNQHTELREFFIDTKLAADLHEAQQYIDRLTADDIDVHTLEHMRGMTAEDLRSAGFSLRLAKAIAAEIAKRFPVRTGRILLNGRAYDD